MQSVEITIEERTACGSSANDRLRKSGYIPAIVYSVGRESRPVKINELQYRRMIAGKGATQLFVFKTEDKDLDGKMALVKEVQHEPLRDEVLHIDFYSFAETQQIRVSVPVVLRGDCLVVKHGDSILNHLLHEVEVECLPTAIPASFGLDITNLVEGHSLQVRDIQLPPNVLVKTSLDLVVVSVVHRKEEVEVVAPVAEVIGEPALVSEEAPAEGAVAAAPDAAGKEKEKEPTKEKKGGVEKKGGAEKKDREGGKS